MINMNSIYMKKAYSELTRSCEYGMIERKISMELRGLTYSDKFLGILNEYTRREFELTFKPSVVDLHYIGRSGIACDCPYKLEDESKCPNKGSSCQDCWKNAIEQSKFKDERGIQVARVDSRDFYLNEDNVFNRIKAEYEQHGNKFVIAYDFDNTVKDPHGKGRTCNDVITLLKKWEGKARFICFTARKPDRYVETLTYLGKMGIPCDKINEGFEGLSNGNEKPYYNVFLDDRAGLCETYNVLNKLLNEISK